MPDPTPDAASNATTPAAGTTPPIVLPPKPKYEWMAALREITTTVIALTILGLTVSMMWQTFAEARGNFQLMKDVLLYILPILGTVMGYYFGRVPAERRAEASEQEATAAQATAENATAQAVQTQNRTDQKLHQVKIAVERAKAKVEGLAPEPQGSAPTVRGGVLGGDSGTTPGASGRTAMYDELDGISKML